MSLYGTEWRERGYGLSRVLAYRITGSTISKPNQLPESESTSASVELPESRLMAFSSSDSTPSAGPPSAWPPSAGFSVSSEETVKKFIISSHVTGVETLQRHNTENSKRVIPEKELHGHSPNFHIHGSVSDIYIPMIDLHSGKYVDRSWEYITCSQRRPLNLFSGNT
jgi:hypothetical protein